MTRPSAVDALFAGHTLPKNKAALDELREYIRGLERIKEAALKVDRPVALVCGGVLHTRYDHQRLAKVIQAHEDNA